MKDRVVRAAGDAGVQSMDAVEEGVNVEKRMAANGWLVVKGVTGWNSERAAGA